MQATLSHYRILEQIGAGGMGAVFRAHDEHLDCDVALKVLLPGDLADDIARKRFRKEALALSKLNHPNIAVVHDFDTQDGTDFLVEELVPGVSLKEMLASGPLPEREILNLGSQLADGLDAAHEQGVIHLDLKPANIRVTPDARLKILDFGLARITKPSSPTTLTASLTQSPAFAGTLPYMAPEQLLGERVDARTDIWGAGCVLFEMATGHAAFAGSGPPLVDAILHRPAPPASKLDPKVSSGLEAIILKCLEKDAANRYQSAKELAVDLRRLRMPSVTAAVAAPRRKARSRAFVFAGALVAAMALAAAGYVFRSHKSRLVATGEINSIAVLPLTNLSGDPNQEYFADGMTEALITDLSKIKALKVISRTSVMRYKGAKKPLPEIARELGVNGIVEGSVLRSGDRVRITAQLIDAREDRHLWADSYDRDLPDVLALHSEVARSIAAQVQVTLMPEEEKRLASARSTNIDAYNAYLQGRYFYGRLTEENLQNAIKYYEQAIKLDAGYALAWASLAEALELQAGAYGTTDCEKAREVAERALALDPNLAQAHVAMGSIKRDCDWDWAGAEASFQRALTLEPGNAETLREAAVLSATLGRFGQALAWNRRAIELNPLDALTYHTLALNALWDDRLDEAAAAVSKALEMNPQHPWSHLVLGRIYLAKSSPQQALAEMQRETHPLFRLQGLAIAYHSLGWHRESDAALAELIAKFHATAAFQIAEVYAFRGEADQAFRWLEKAVVQRDGGLIYLRRDPLLKNLEPDPRYAAFLKKMHLPV